MFTNKIHHFAFLLYLINVFHEIVLCSQQVLVVRDAVPALMGWFHGCGPRQLIALDRVEIHEDDCDEINTDLE